MAITQVGTPQALGTTRTAGTNSVSASPVVGQWSGTQTLNAGDLLVACVVATGTTSAAATAQNTGTTGWTKQFEAGAGTPALCAIWTKTAAGGDAAPQFTSVISGTATMTCTLYELAGVNPVSPVDAHGTGTLASGGNSSITVTTTTSVTNAGEFAIGVFAHERGTAATRTITATGTGYSLVTSDGTISSTGHTGCTDNSGPAPGATSSAGMSVTGTVTTSTMAGVLVVFAAITSGPPLASSLQSPAGLVVSLVRTGVAMTSLIPGASAPPPPPATGPVFFPAVQAVRAKYLPNFPLAGSVNDAPPSTGAVPGPVNGAGLGSGIGSAGGPVSNPTRGPLFRQATQVIRGRLPQQPFLRGRCYSTPAPQAAPPAPRVGPVFRQRTTPVRFILPPWQPRAGRIGSSFGAPVINPVRGPTFIPASRPAQARRPLPAGGRVYATPLILAAPPAPHVAPFRQAASPARARITPPLRGRVTASPGGPVRNPNVVAVYGSVPGPVRAALPVVPHGRAASNPGAPVRNPAPPTTGPPFRQASQPARIRPSLPPRGRVASNRGAPVRNPQHGPAFTQAVKPARIRPSLPPRGRTGSNPGGPLANPGSPGVSSGQPAGIRVIYLLAGRTHSTPPYVPPHNPAPPGAPVPPRSQAVRAQIPLLPPFGRAATMVALPVPVNPSQGPAFRQATSPVRPRRPLPSHGRTASNAGGPVQNPSRGPGPVFFPRRDPARIRPSLPPRGRVASGSGGPVQNPAPPAAGPPFRPAAQAVRAKVPPQPPWGRAATMVAIPVPVNPASTGPVFRQATSPAKARLPVPFLKGRCSGNPGGPLANPSVPPPPSRPGQPAGIRVIYLYTGRARSTPSYPPATPPPPPSTGPAFRQATQPARIRPSLPARGRASGSPGGPVRNPPPPVAGPVFFPFRQAVRAKPATPPPYGRAATMVALPAPVNPAQGPAFRPATSPVQARRPLPPRGRIGSNPGIPVPPPQAGPRFTQRHDPARFRPVLPLRGRTSGNAGGPVRNPHPGPVFRQAVRPIRAVIPQNAPRGRTASNPGGPVQNIPLATALFRLGSPYFGWQAEDPAVTSVWNAGTAGFQWQAGNSETSS